MDQGQQLFFMVIIIVLFGGMMWWSSRKTRKQQKETQDFRKNLQPGEEVITIGGVIGKVVSVDPQYEEIVLDSEGSLMRFTFRAIHKAYTRPAFIPDSEVDEQGNPLPEATGESSDEVSPAPSDSTSSSAESVSSAEAVSSAESVSSAEAGTPVTDSDPVDGTTPSSASAPNAANAR